MPRLWGTSPIIPSVTGTVSSVTPAMVPGNRLIELLPIAFDWVLLLLVSLFSLVSAGHALLYKRDPRSALGWIVVCLVFPLVGPVLYLLLGINRVRTKAQRLLRHRPLIFPFGYERPEDAEVSEYPDLEIPPELAEFARVSGAVTRTPLVKLNRIEPLSGGEQAYPAMLDAIEKAHQFVFLATYIFDTDTVGLRFVDALVRAAGRGVDVRVIIDGVGEWYGFPRAGSLLLKRGVRVARFLPPRLIPPSLSMNLRNHRKILVADGRVGFTGGMNIGRRHLAEDRNNPARVFDMHFRLTGPVVTQLARVFLEDWAFAYGNHEPLEFPPETPGPGQATCRAVVDGPNEDLEKLSRILVGAVGVAKKNILIVTPYFLPSRELIGALQSAALRGVKVTVILPERSNLPYVDWASRNMLWEVLRWGVNVYHQPGPFAHTKLFLVDDHYAHIGSANLDPRSLRLNFELVVEIFDPPFGRVLAKQIEQIRSRSREVSLAELDGRPLPIRLRDAVAWLFSPYL